MANGMGLEDNDDSEESELTTASDSDSDDEHEQDHHDDEGRDHGDDGEDCPEQYPSKRRPSNSLTLEQSATMSNQKNIEESLSER